MQDHHDLPKLLDALNTVYFDGLVQVDIGWLKTTAPRDGIKRKGIKLGLCYVQDRLILINPVLNASWVPMYYVSSVIFHEMLHVVIQPKFKPGKVEAIWADDVEEWHTPEFLAAEARYVHAARAAAWEKKNLARLLKSDCRDHTKIRGARKTTGV